ncbi:ABC transporter substrate-binding protein [Pelagibacterium xiamenense]|uniref:ABC transporter substrate-binding protein n=1 Tax=Pelagibacterium xiamenense TaxID=2901140 RepID=UPI001E42CF21|nr:extracellular solute-binding protein [Pelagibacterium xiamenense]MCD7058782.1 extracellular solute-binding protein [Pelagibacterium xiamenense]
MKSLTISIAVVAVLTAPAIAQTELRITHSMTGGSNRDALDQIIANFEAEHPDIAIEQIVFDDDLYSGTGLITQLQSSSVPDIYFQWAGYPVLRDADAGYAMNLSDALAEDGWKDSFLESVWTEGAGTLVDGEAYMVPMSIDLTNTIWYNTAMFAEHGLEPPATWDEFIALIETLAAAGETPVIEGNSELWPLGNWASHIASRVVPVEEYEAAFNQDGPFNTAGFTRALELIDQLQEAGAFNRDLQGLGADPAMAGFFQGAAAMHPIGSWLIGSASELADEGFDYDQFDTPMIDPDHPLSDSVIGTVTGWIVHDQSANKDAAITFLKFFTSEESQTIWAETGALLSPVAGVNDSADLDEKTQSVAAMIAEAGSMVPPPDTTYPVPVAEAFYQAAAYVAAGERTPEEALTWLDETIAAMGPQ